MNDSPIYYIKPSWENANSNFSRKFAPGFSIDINKGGFDLHFGVEKPAVNCDYQELLMLKVDQYYTYDISVYDDLISKVLFSNS